MPQPISLQPGMRVRCVRAGFGLQLGDECMIQHVHQTMVVLKDCLGWFAGSRFKPVVRVKAGSRPSNRHIFAEAH